MVKDMPALELCGAFLAATMHHAWAAYSTAGGTHGGGRGAASASSAKGLLVPFSFDLPHAVLRRAPGTLGERLASHLGLEEVTLFSAGLSGSKNGAFERASASSAVHAKRQSTSQPWPPVAGGSPTADTRSIPTTSDQPQDVDGGRCLGLEDGSLVHGDHLAIAATV